MQRMHSLGPSVGLDRFHFHAAIGASAHAALLRFNDTRQYPDLTIRQRVSDTYNPSTGTGVFQLSNVHIPAHASRTTPTSGFVESRRRRPPTTSGRKDAHRSRHFANGNLVNSPLNSFQVYGTVGVGGQTYTGLLLSGTPTAFVHRTEAARG